jgi:hypothetical protein
MRRRINLKKTKKNKSPKVRNLNKFERQRKFARISRAVILGTFSRMFFHTTPNQHCEMDPRLAELQQENARLKQTLNKMKDLNHYLEVYMKHYLSTDDAKQIIDYHYKSYKLSKLSEKNATKQLNNIGSRVDKNIKNIGNIVNDTITDLYKREALNIYVHEYEQKKINKDNNKKALIELKKKQELELQQLLEQQRTNKIAQYNDENKHNINNNAGIQYSNNVGIQSNYMNNPNYYLEKQQANNQSRNNNNEDMMPFLNNNLERLCLD